ncbi:MAG: hypothetical protein KAG06_00145 [Methylococcales bacterium]|nr:hypothetical protein [Methylococcales bacterium]
MSGCSGRPLSQEKIISWQSKEGITRLEESAYKIDFFTLASHFDFQDNRLFCGAATSSMVLNALRLKNDDFTLPKDSSVLTVFDFKYLPEKWSPFYARYTQNNIFLKDTKARSLVLGKRAIKLRGGQKKSDAGFQLRQLHQLFEKHGAKTILRVVDKNLTLMNMKTDFLENLARANDYVVINFQRAVLTPAKKVGHFSPIAAYHQASDSFLLLDVTPNKSGWIWVQADLLFKAMQTFDTVENRGYLLVSEGQNNKP